MDTYIQKEKTIEHCFVLKSTYIICFWKFENVITKHLVLLPSGFQHSIPDRC